MLVSSSLGRLLLAVAVSSLLRTPSRISRLQQDPSPPAPTSGVRSRPNSDCGRVSDRPVPVHDESDAERAVACAPCELERGSRISNSRPYPLTATSAFAAISAPHSNARLAVSIGRPSARSTASITHFGRGRPRGDSAPWIDLDYAVWVGPSQEFARRPQPQLDRASSTSAERGRPELPQDPRQHADAPRQRRRHERARIRRSTSPFARGFPDCKASAG